jgi:hypothetical protein
VSSYVRPTIGEQIFRDVDGAVIEYGARWGVQGPPVDRYSLALHPERFAPLHRVGEALIDHLQRSYDVEVADDPTFVQHMGYPVDAVRGVRLTPAAADAAPLTFVFTAYPGLIVRAGLLHDFPYPVCECEACDETWASVADELEWTVDTVVSGGYREEIGGTEREPSCWYVLRAADGTRTSSGGNSRTRDAAQLQRASKRLAALPGGWAAWPRR